MASATSSAVHMMSNGMFRQQHTEGLSSQPFSNATMCMTPANARQRLFALRFRTELCRTHQTTGQCNYRDKCMFAHGVSELRTQEVNLADGLESDKAIRSWLRSQRRSHTSSSNALIQPSLFNVHYTTQASSELSQSNSKLLPESTAHHRSSAACHDAAIDEDIPASLMTLVASIIAE